MEDFENYQGHESHSDPSKPFDDGYSGYDPRINSARFDDSFRMPSYSDEHFPPVEESKDDVYDNLGDASPGYEPPSFENGVHGVSMDSPSNAFGDSFSEHQDFGSRGNFSPAASDLNGQSFPAAEEGYEFMEAPVFGSGNNGSVLPPPEEMEPEEGFLLREWKRQNAEKLAEKERLEKERLTMIMDDADAYKDEFLAKRHSHCEAQKNNNRDKEKVFLAGQEHFHKSADKHYWKAVSELIPAEIPTIETKRNKDRNKVTVIFNQGPKPGKATDLSRMRQILLKLKHNPPAHMKTAPPPPPPKAAEGGDKAKEAENKAPPAASPPPPVVEAAA
ncbi:clathrin light chain 2 [Selaginella moellendorffii]|nr:clathrin light chain 2 [Selaginella moellendorffii]|eukprot:XP_002977772.2 clathrin light chain 2 [Selaginella moellendorffii]